MLIYVVWLCRFPRKQAIALEMMGCEIRPNPDVRTDWVTAVAYPF